MWVSGGLDHLSIEKNLKLWTIFGLNAKTAGLYVIFKILDEVHI
jgi:hypothetical protein